MRMRRNLPGLNRRRFLTASAAGLGAAALTASGTAAASASPGSISQASGSLTEAVLAALRTHRVVAVTGGHAEQETNDLLLTLLSDSRLYGVANDIIVEFGNAFYQDTLDKFILGDEPVNDADLRLVYRNTTQSPMNLGLDSPVNEQIFRRVRAVNWTLPPEKRIRVLAGDPPLDWSKVTSSEQILALATQRNAHPASLVEQQVLAKGRRALLIYGGGHLFHTDTSSIPSLIEQKTGIRAYVILDPIPFTTDPGGLTPSAASRWERSSTPSCTSARPPI